MASSSFSTLSRLDWAVAAFAIVAIIAHDLAHITSGRWYDAFWVCNVAALCVGPAIALRSATLSAMAMTWLLPGTIVWLLDVFVAGSHILPTSYAIHLGGTLASFYAVRRNGYPPRGWISALALPAACFLFSRLALPASANVNAAHAVPTGWHFLGQSRLSFVASATAIVLGVCAIGYVIGRALSPTDAERSARPA